MKPREQRLIKIEAPFIDEISDLVIIKILDKLTRTLMLKLKFVRNTVSLDVTNSSFELGIFYSKEMLGILDLRLIGYYKIKHVVLQQNLIKYFRLESADILCEQFNKFVNTLKKEKEEIKDKYPCLDKEIEKRSMSNKEILEKYVFRKVMSIRIRKKGNNDMLYKYKDTFRGRD